jgi:hypothetical protein
MTSGEMLRISPEEDRAGAPLAKPTSPINVSTAARRRRAVRNEMPTQTRHRTRAFGTRAAGAPAGPPRKMRGILGGSA